MLEKFLLQLLVPIRTPSQQSLVFGNFCESLFNEGHTNHTECDFILGQFEEECLVIGKYDTLTEDLFLEFSLRFWGDCILRRIQSTHEQ